MKKKDRKPPEINTSSLPDIIFMLLFFFMVVTVLRTSQVKMNLEIPDTEDPTKIKNQSYVNTIYVGYSQITKNNVVVQLNDSFIKVEEIELAIRSLNARYDVDVQSLISTSLKVDKNVEMGIVNAIKLQLRKAESLKLNYIANNEFLP